MSSIPVFAPVSSELSWPSIQSQKSPFRELDQRTKKTQLHPVLDLPETKQKIRFTKSLYLQPFLYSARPAATMLEKIVNRAAAFGCICHHYFICLFRSFFFLARIRMRKFRAPSALRRHSSQNRSRTGRRVRARHDPPS